MEEPLSQQELYELASIDQRRSRLNAHSMKRVMSRLLATRGYAAIQATSVLQDVWNHIVGPDLAANSRPGNVRGGSLFVAVRDSLSMQELHFRKAEILRKLQSQLPDQKLKELKFRIESF